MGVAPIIVWDRDGVQGRLDYGCLRGSQKPLRSYRQLQSLSVIVKIPAKLRIPMKSAGDSERKRPPVPIEASRAF